MTNQNDSEFGPWQDHDGKGCPCVGKMVHVIWHAHDGCGTEFEHDGFGIAGIAGDECWRWETRPKFSRVIRYRIRKPRALLDLIQLIADMPAPVAPIKTDGVIA